jgi:stage II sporulation protein D
VPAAWPAAALRAQAVAARTYAAYERAHAPQSRHYDLCDTTACQVYGGVAAEVPRTDAAVAATAHRVVRYGGAAAFTQFSASNGGFSVDGGFPYLPARPDRFDHGYPGDPWRVRLGARAITRHWSGLGRLQSVRVLERDGHGSYGGRALVVRVSGTRGSVRVSGSTFRSYLGLRSTMFRITSR